MPTYAYQVRDGSRRLTEGTLQAESRLVALDKLAEMGCFPVRLEERGAPAGGRRPFFRTVSGKDLGFFVRQVADLLESGVPLLKALEVSSEQTDSRALARTVGLISGEVKGGAALFEAMARRPDVFAPLHVSLARAGETGGRLPEVLSRLADFVEQEEELRSRVRAALAYPALIVAAGLGTLLFLILFVLPRLAALFGDMGQELPWATRALLRLGGVPASAGGWAAVSALAAAALLAAGGGRRAALSWDRMVFRIPVWGKAVKKLALARFARTLAALLAGGVSIVEALETAAGVLGHPALRSQVLEAARLVRGGESLAGSLRRMDAFPGFVRHMIAVGEEANTLEKSLAKIAGAYEREADRALKLATSLLEPALILAVGGVIGIIVVAMLLPIFDIPALLK